MKQFVQNSASGSVSEAVSGLKDPKVISMYVGDAAKFEEKVAELERLFPGVPSVACVANAYARTMMDRGVTIIAFTEGVQAVTGVILEASTAPVKSVESLEKNIRSLNPGRDNTVMIDFCTGNDACVLTTIHEILEKRGIALTGGTGDGGKVACNGQVYDDADVYMLVKNLGGKVRTYKENIYRPMKEFRFIASDTDRSRYYVGKLNGRSAKRVYAEALNIPESAIKDQTMSNPLGKITGKDVCIISIKDLEGEGITCYRQVNDSDVLSLLEIKDYHEIVRETVEQVRRDFQKVSCVYSVNCIFRYLYFGNHGSMNDYLSEMNALNNHCGFVGFGEHCNSQFINQSMSCVVFE